MNARTLEALKAALTKDALLVIGIACVVVIVGSICARAHRVL